MSTISTFTPRSNRTLTSNRGVTFTTTMRMVVRVHGNAAVCRTDTHPAGTAGFTNRDVFVIQVTYLTDSSTAVNMYLAYFTGGQAEQGIIAFLSHQLGSCRPSAGGIDHHAR